MDSNRARQILQSKELIRVLHNDTPVWIDNVMDNDTAEITFIDEHKKGTVAVNLLVESKIPHN